MKLTCRPIADLKQAKRRIRAGDAQQIEAVARSLKAVGQCAPIILNSEGHIINGHIVVEAMKVLGATEIWCVVLEDLTQGEAEFLQIALNKLSDGSEWLIEKLRPVLLDLEVFGFDLTSTGFSLPELDILMLDEPLAASAEESAQEGPDHEAVPVSRLGDLWEFDNRHRLLCGDATKAESYASVLSGAQAVAVFTDCPWNLPQEVISNFGKKKKHGSFKMGAGEMTGASLDA
jgi:hypothetical protein